MSKIVNHIVKYQTIYVGAACLILGAVGGLWYAKTIGSNSVLTRKTLALLNLTADQTQNAALKAVDAGKDLTEKAIDISKNTVENTIDVSKNVAAKAVDVSKNTVESVVRTNLQPKILKVDVKALKKTGLDFKPIDKIV